MFPRRERLRRVQLAVAVVAVALGGPTEIASRAEDGGSAPAAAPSYTITVYAPGGTPQPVSASIDGDEARRLPGTGGDPALAAQNLPGIARPAPGGTGLVMWGAAPTESRVLFDGVEIPALYHLGGFRSTVGAELPGRIEVVPGAYTAGYGRALGGLVRIDSRRPPHDGTHLFVDANVLDASAGLRGVLFERLRISAAARTSYLGQTYGRVAPASSTALFPIPRYSDAQLEAALDISEQATLRALVLTSVDRVSRALDGAASGLPDRIEDQGQAWWRAALFYEERGEDEGLATALFVGGDRNTLEQRFATTPASQEVSSMRLGLRAGYGARLDGGLRIRLGVDGLVERALLHRAGSLNVPAREGDMTVFGETPGADVSADSWAVTSADVAPFVTTSLVRGRWRLSPGLRADAFAVDGNRALPPVGATPRTGFSRLTWTLDPRVSLACSVTSALTWTASAGVYHQPVDAVDLGAVFGSPALGPERALHATLSAWARLTQLTSLTVTGFYRRLDGLVVRSPLAAPALAQALIPAGAGRSLGADVLLRRELSNGTLAWLTYTLGRSERWSAGGSARLLDFDQTHVFNAIASHRRGAWTVSGRARYATGMPRTPVVGSFFDIRDGAYQPVFGTQNSTRLPPFFQLDARIDRTWVAGPISVTIYLDLQNLTARRNAEERVYSRAFTASGYLTGPPLLILLGVRIES